MDVTRLQAPGAGVSLRPRSGQPGGPDERLMELIPKQHRAFLAATNGLEAFGGHYRIFGVGSGSARDISTWNHRASWKFAWPTPLEDFLCFGESSFGDQYAYRTTELTELSTEPRVYCLDGLEAQMQTIFTDFNDFLDREVETWISGPRDDLVMLAREKLGDVQPGDQLNFIPPLWLAPAASERLVRLDARVNMILNGDLCSQLATAGDRQVASLQPWTDKEGRPRMKVLFVDDQ